MGFSPASEVQLMNKEPNLDLLYFHPYIPKQAERDLFVFLRDNLFFYRVQYSINRGGVDTRVNTPRYTTVFGVDESSYFAQDGALLDKKSHALIPKDRYSCKPRPIPGPLDFLRRLTEASIGDTFNFCLVNYYADGNDSIAYHSDDERFLGENPTIASFSLGATRDFLMKAKSNVPEAKPLKMHLASGDLLVMRGPTQANWLHSIPKRSGEAGKGRINITFRKAVIRGGTENYYRYNVGSGPVFRWDNGKESMVSA
jgi:hypothetical protein